MRYRITVFLLFLLFAPASLSHAQTLSNGDTLSGLAPLLDDRQPPAASGPALTLDDVQRIALARNPEIEVAARRVAVAKAHIPAAGALDDPTLMYRGWGVPLRQPWNYNDAQNMFSVSQVLPGPGKRALRTGVAESDVEESTSELEQVRLQVRVRVHKAFDDMLLANEEMRIHAQHVGIARQAIAAAQIKYTVGKVPQQDILKAQVALARLGEHMIRFDRDANLARARLNTLLGRDPAAPLNVHGAYAVLAPLPSEQALQQLALYSRPDLAGAQVAADRSRKEQSLAKKAYIPDVTVSGGYMLAQPTVEMRNNYMVEASMNMPWLNRRKHNAEIAEASAQTTEQDAELAEMRNAAFGQVQEALVQARAAQNFALLYRDKLRPQAEATLQSSVIAYENNKADFLELLDSQMTVIDIDLAWVQAVADFDARLADLELAAGAPLQQAQSVTPEVKP
jgi:outer membrane protein, heavy metal efflux system